jgi:serine protease AprX
MKYIFSVSFILISFSIVAQNVKHDIFMVSLTDKNNNPFSVFHPQEYLSMRALERREMQQISIDERDLPVNPDYVAKIEALGGVIVLKSKWLNAVSVYIPDSIKKSKIDNLPFVMDVMPLGFRKEPKDYKILEHFPYEKYNEQDNYYGLTLNQVAMLSGHVLHGMGFAGEGKRVAIFDGGFTSVYRMPAFDSLYANNRILGTRDFVEGDEFVYEASSHGTNVLSCMAANLPYLVMGTAPSASYYLFKTEDVGSEFKIEEFNWLVAAEHADSLGVDVINSSLGYTTFNDADMNYKYEDLNGRTGICTRGADIAVEKGMLVVNSAGNEGDGSWKYIGTPADGVNVISVGAVRANGSRASFSSFGPTPDGRIKPNVSAQGNRASVAGMKGYAVTQTDGTSFSSPIMAGMVTTLWSAFPERSNWDIKDAIEAAGNQTMQPDSSLGYGIPDFFSAYLSLMDAGIAITSKGQMYSTRTLIMDELKLMVETDKVCSIKYTLYNKLDVLLYQNMVSSGPYEVRLLDLPLLKDLAPDVYYIKIEVGDQCHYSEIIKG